MPDAPGIGRWLGAAGCEPDLVLCSPARRTRETWQLASAALGATPPVTLESVIYGGSAESLLDLVRHAPGAARTVALIGHDPGIRDLALMLSAASADDAPAAREAAALDRIRVKFPTAAIAVLAFSGSWERLGHTRAHLAEFITPRELAGNA
ncbi:MAG: histidine phosphatase family protein [Actinomycetota bacterium]|nr:histidine phosphatase family protein [Actinomycetota bacterium]